MNAHDDSYLHLHGFVQHHTGQIISDHDTVRRIRSGRFDEKSDIIPGAGEVLGGEVAQRVQHFTQRYGRMRGTDVHIDRGR